jgi:transcriptional regulator with XRE-family HTH domain
MEHHLSYSRQFVQLCVTEARSTLDEVIAGIGPKIHLLRQGDGLSLQQLAERSGVSAAAIHKIERNNMVPTITTLMKLARALDRSVSYLVDEDIDTTSSAVLVRAKDRGTLSASRDGVNMQNIAGPSGRYALAGSVVTIAPGQDSGRAPLTHPGEELIYLLSGSLEFEAGAAYRLSQGDSLHLRTDRPHRWWNSSTRPAKALWISLRTS